MKKSSRLGRRLILSFALAATLPLLVSGALFGWGFVRFNNEDVRARQASVVEVGSAYVEAYFNDLFERMTLLAGLVNLDEPPREWLAELESSCRRMKETYFSIAFVDMKGDEIARLEHCAAQPAFTLRNRAREEAFFRAQRGETYLRNVSFNRQSQPISTISLNAKTGDGADLIVIGQADLGNIWQPLNELQIGDDGYLFVVDQRGNLVGYRDPALIKQERNLAYLPSVAPLLVGKTGASALRYIGLNGEEVIGTSAAIPRIGWALALEQPAARVYAARNIFAVQLAAALAVFLSAAALIALSLTKSIVQPIESLEKTAREISAGNLQARIAVRSDDEIGELAKSFARMQSELAASYGELERRVAERTRDLRVAAQVSRRITQTLNLNELLPMMTRLLQREFRLYSVSVYLLQPESGLLILSAASDSEETLRRAIREISLTAENSLIAKAARERKTAVANDVSRAEVYLPDPALPYAQAEATFPMEVGGELIGALDLLSDQRGRFGEAEIQIFTTLAEQISIAVRNARLYSMQVQAADELRRADALKTQFHASVSHELRTPLNAIINFVEMIVNEMVGPVPEEQKTLLKLVLQSSMHLLAQINDILDMSKIQAGKTALYVEDDVNLYEILDGVIDVAAPMFAEKPVKFRLEIDGGLPKVACDKRRVRQILLNLLSNAAKFTEQGEVVLRAEARGDHILFFVRDSGKGVSPEAQAVIFEPYVQTPDGIKKEQGTGLGLPISRGFARAHGGDLWVQSEMGKGSTFFFSLPLQAAWRPE